MRELQHVLSSFAEAIVGIPDLLVRSYTLLFKQGFTPALQLIISKRLGGATGLAFRTGMITYTTGGTGRSAAF